MAGVSSFDPPPGDGREHPELVDAVSDRDPTTSWHTATYRRADLGGLKPGVGLVLRLTGRHRVGRLEVDSPTRSWTASVYVAGSPSATLVGWGQPVATRTGIDGSTTFELHGADGGAVLLWITRLGPVADGFGADVSEVRLFAP